MKNKFKIIVVWVSLFLIIYGGLTSLELSYESFDIIPIFMTTILLTTPTILFWKPKIEKLLKIGEKETVEYKEKQYKILHQAKLKNPKTREWEDVVVYENGCGVYVREKEEFYERFK